VRLAIIVSGGLLVACAQAGERGGDSPAPDGSSSGFVDAAPLPPIPDAAPLPDAPPSSGLPDATPGTGGADADPGPFCASSTECGVPGECCFYLIMPPGFCVPGQEDPILGCLPDD
jgi:hypothetical protein